MARKRHTTRTDLEHALNVLRTIPQTYNSQGPDVVIQEMEHILAQVFTGEWSGVSQTVPPLPVHWRIA